MGPSGRSEAGISEAGRASAGRPGAGVTDDARRRWRCRGVHLGLLLLVAAGPAAPPLRERVVGEDYDHKVAELLKQPAPPAAEPDEGAVVTGVVRHSVGEKAGFHAGDVICGVDGKPVAGLPSLLRRREGATGEQTLDVWTPGKADRRSIRVPADDLELLLADWAPPSVQYLHGLPAGAKPVDELRLAAMAAAAHGGLAETALARARQAGVDGPAFDLLAATATWDEGRPADALPYATAALAAGGLSDAQRRSADRIAYRCDLALYRWPEALRVATADPDAPGFLDQQYHEGESLAADVAAADDVPIDTRPGDAVRAFDALSPTDRTAEIVSRADPRDKDYSKIDADVFRRSGGVSMDVPSDHYEACIFGPTGADVDLGADVQFHRKDDRYSSWPKGVTLAVVPAGHVSSTWGEDPQGGGVYPEAAVQVLIRTDGGPSVVTGRGIPPCVMSLGQLVDAGPFCRVRVTVVGRWCRVTVGHKEVFAGPVSAGLDEGDRHLCGVVQSCSVVARWRSLRWRTAAGRP